MDNIINAQKDTKTFLKRLSIISAFAFALILSLSLSNTYAEPPHGGADCETHDKNDDWEVLWCCWTETDPTDPEKIEINKCQSCIVADGSVNCSPPTPDPNPAPPTTGENIVPENDEGLEQPPTENQPPIRSGNSVSPNEDSTVIDESQPTNPNPPLTDQRVPPGNVGVLEQLDDSSNNEQSQESDELNQANNADSASNTQENDASSTSDTTDSEVTTSFAKKGNSQNSPVPPECPKQGPIPPDCTMKPKF